MARFSIETPNHRSQWTADEDKLLLAIKQPPGYNILPFEEAAGITGRTLAAVKKRWQILHTFSRSPEDLTSPRPMAEMPSSPVLREQFALDDINARLDDLGAGMVALNDKVDTMAGQVDALVLLLYPKPENPDPLARFRK